MSKYWAICYKDDGGGGYTKNHLPSDALDAINAVFAIGAEKYGPDNWADENNGGGDHVAAALRHIGAHLGGKRWDDCEETRLHLAHAAARLVMALSKELKK